MSLLLNDVATIIIIVMSILVVITSIRVSMKSATRWEKMLFRIFVVTGGYMLSMYVVSLSHSLSHVGSRITDFDYLVLPGVILLLSSLLAMIITHDHRSTK